MSNLYQTGTNLGALHGLLVNFRTAHLIANVSNHVPLYYTDYKRMDRHTG